MAAVAFDSLEYAHQLEAAGMPRNQAEVVAKGLTSMFIHNFDALVTKDYLDTRFNEFETRVEAKMDKRFAQVDMRFAQVDMRFAQLETKMELRFAQSDAKTGTSFARLQVIAGVILVAVAIPLLQSLWALLG
tara:strand:+ start:216 stop:611 length:396 start_codon:yes stop_codon:yes gene_type:complete